MSISGRCLCGSVHYRTEAAPILQFNCHCRDCQRSTGAGFAPIMFFIKADLVVEGTLSHFDSLAASGNSLRRSFCPTCGAQVLGAPAAASTLISIRAGTLDDPSQFTPMADIFCAQATPWSCMNPHIAKFPEMLPTPKQR